MATEASLQEVDGIETTEEELEGFRIVKAIVCKVLRPEQIVHRDAKSYFAILCDDNNRKPICRLHFNTTKKYLGIIDAEKKETRHELEQGVESIYQFTEQLRDTASRYAAAAP